MDASYLPPGEIVARHPIRSDGCLRLSTVLAATGFFTRKQLKHARPRLNGETVRTDVKLDFGVTPRWEIVVFGSHFIVESDDSLLLAMHKPVGFVTSHASGALDASSETVFDLLPEWLASAQLEPIGRLDKETSGLLLLTEDGSLNQRIRHPSRNTPRSYIAQLARPITQDAARAALRQGVPLRDGTTASPTELEQLPNSTNLWRVTLTEGKYHEVRRLFAALDSHVELLHRDRYDAFRLLSDIPAEAGWQAGIPLIDALEDIAGKNCIALRHGLTRVTGRAKQSVLERFHLDDAQRFAQISHAVSDS